MMVYYIHRVLIINTLAEQCAVFQILVSYLFTTYGYEDNEGGSKNARSYPLSYVYSGYYNWATGRLYRQALHDNYWSSTIYSSSFSYHLHMTGSRLVKANTNTKHFGYALRCIPK